MSTRLAGGRPQTGRALLGVYERMRAIRAFEETVSAAYADRRLPGLLHLSIGGEGVAVGVISRLGPEDRLYTGHRGHGHFLAAGVDPSAVMAELAGRETGLCRGRGGSMHLMSERAVMATGVVGGTLPIALGHALALAEPAVVVAFFGDGAAQTGVFHETMNLASLWRARVLFVCENNGWAEFTAREEHTKVADVASYGHLFGMPVRTVDGADVEAVMAAADDLLAGVRSGGGPALLECRITRLRPHYEGDLRRTDEDDARDPVRRAAQRITALGVDAREVAAADERARAAAETALGEAMAAAEPSIQNDDRLVFRRWPR